MMRIVAQLSKNNKIYLWLNGHRRSWYLKNGFARWLAGGFYAQKCGREFLHDSAYSLNCSIFTYTVVSSISRQSKGSRWQNENLKKGKSESTSSESHLVAVLLMVLVVLLQKNKYKNTY